MRNRLVLTSTVALMLLLSTGVNGAELGAESTLQPTANAPVVEQQEMTDQTQASDVVQVEENQTDDVRTITATTLPVATYRTQIQNVGWQGWKSDGAMSGTEGKSYRLEGIELKLNGAGENLGIQYQTHVQNIGWQGWKSDGAMSGTEGKSLRLEAIQIKLTGTDASKYDVYYQVHAENYGWLGWAKNGESAGTAGYGYRLEAIKIVLVNAGSAAPTTITKEAYYEKTTDAGSGDGGEKPVTQYTINYDTQGGSEVPAATVNKGELITKPTDPTRDNYTFAGWYKNKSCTFAWKFDTAKVYLNTTLYAKWVAGGTGTGGDTGGGTTVNQYTITFDSQGGSAVPAATVNKGELVTKPADPTKEGYTFAGWCKNKSGTVAWKFETAKVYVNTTLFAKWVKSSSDTGGDTGGGTTVNQYTITFDSQGGSAVPAATVNKGELVTKPADPTKEGYTFAGWYKNKSGTVAWKFETAKVYVNTTLFAKWVKSGSDTGGDTGGGTTVNQYTITFDSQGGSGVTAATVNKGELVTKPADPTKEGYTFAGWCKNKSGTVAWKFETAKVYVNTTLFAKWVKK